MCDRRRACACAPRALRLLSFVHTHRAVRTRHAPREEKSHGRGSASVRTDPRQCSAQGASRCASAMTECEEWRQRAMIRSSSGATVRATGGDPACARSPAIRSHTCDRNADGLSCGNERPRLFAECSKRAASMCGIDDRRRCVGTPRCDSNIQMHVRQHTPASGMRHRPLCEA